jgi:hypothetical protein
MPKLRHIPTGGYVGDENTNKPNEFIFDRAGKVESIITPFDRANEYDLDTCYRVQNTHTEHMDGFEFEIVAPHGEWWKGKFLQA